MAAPFFEMQCVFFAFAFLDLVGDTCSARVIVSVCVSVHLLVANVSSVCVLLPIMTVLQHNFTNRYT